jgi:hypothetical protein
MISAIEALAPLQLLLFPCSDGIDYIIWNPKRPDYLVIQYAHTAGRHRSHRKLLVAGDTELPYQENVEGRMECLRHLVSNRYSSARKRKHQHARLIRVRRKLLRKLPACFGPIAKSRLFMQWRVHESRSPAGPRLANEASHEPVRRG